MPSFQYTNRQLNAENVPLAGIAEEFGTPCFVYSRAAIEQQWLSYDKAFADRAHLICYAVKANGNLAILNLLARLGSGFDIVSGGELQRVLQAGGDPGKIIFSGVGKTREEMRQALAAGIKCFNVESRSELLALDAVAREMSKVAPVSLRVNPDVDANTHPYIATGLRENKFGIDINEAESIYREAMSLNNLRVDGIDCHIGSQITNVDPFLDAVAHLMMLISRLKENDIPLRHIDVGGGLGITYNGETPPAPPVWVEKIVQAIPDPTLEILIEPGRSIVGNAGLLLTRVLYIKKGREKNFAVVDAAMNDLIRPALYSAWQEIVPVRQEPEAKTARYDIVGPVCESGDFLGLNRDLALKEGDLLAVYGAGAYGFSMSSNYNTRPRAAEILVDAGQAHRVRRRESIEDLMRDETVLPE